MQQWQMFFMIHIVYFISLQLQVCYILVIKSENHQHIIYNIQLPELAVRLLLLLFVISQVELPTL